MTRINKAIRKFWSGAEGTSVISFAILAPVLIAVAFGFSWLGHMADAQSVVEEAARAGARWMAVHPGDSENAKIEAAEVVDTAMEGGYLLKSWNGVAAEEIFNPAEDIYCSDPVVGDGTGNKRTDGYAYCRVVYNYPVPMRNFWNLIAAAGVPLWNNEDNKTRQLTGEAFFVSGETGDTT